MLFRADAPAKATGADLSFLRSLGLVQVIDLRGDSEVEAFGIGAWEPPFDEVRRGYGTFGAFLHGLDLDIAQPRRNLLS
jgi:Tyrosine phosphatase family